jgi:hypothetical protein
MKNKFKTIIAISLFSISSVAWAQNDCTNSLYEGNKLFESGKLQDCINTLEACLAKKNDREELIESYHLLAQSYQNLGNTEKAFVYIKKMLMLKHDYQLYPNIDPVDFSALVNKFTVSPKLYLGLKFGFNRNSVALKQSFSAYASTQRYLPKTGFQFGLTADYRIKPTISVNGDMFFAGVGINHIIDNAGGWKQNYNEQQNYFLLNLSGQKHFKVTKNLGAYVGLGFGVGYMASSNVFFESTHLETKLTQQSTQNPIQTRNRLQTNINGVAGASLGVAQGLLSLESNVCYFLGKTVNPDKRMDDLNFIMNNQYVNDDIHLRTIMVNVSYKLPLIWKIQLKK